MPVVSTEVREALQIAEPLIGALARADYYSDEAVSLAKQVLKDTFSPEECELIFKLLDLVRA